MVEARKPETQEQETQASAHIEFRKLGEQGLDELREPSRIHFELNLHWIKDL
jgi:hypothetical protein